MKVEGDGGVKRVGRRGVSWACLSVCAKTPELWAGIPSPILGRGCGPGQEGPPGSKEPCQWRASHSLGHTAIGVKIFPSPARRWVTRYLHPLPSQSPSWPQYWFELKIPVAFPRRSSWHSPARLFPPYTVHADTFGCMSRPQGPHYFFLLYLGTHKEPTNCVSHSAALSGKSQIN